MAHILVVEDDAAIRHLVVEVLASDGHETDEAVDGLAAYNMVRGDTAPDLVVLDLFMPRMDGWEFLNVCRMVPACAAMPIVVLSASDQPPADKRVRAFLKKPFDLTILSDAIRYILDGRGQAKPN